MIEPPHLRLEHEVTSAPILASYCLSLVSSFTPCEVTHAIVLTQSMYEFITMSFLQSKSLLRGMNKHK